MGVALLCCMCLYASVVTSTATSVPITENITEHMATSTSDFREPEVVANPVEVATPVEAEQSAELFIQHFFFTNLEAFP